MFRAWKNNNAGGDFHIFGNRGLRSLVYDYPAKSDD
jgi:hypothetical protein